MLGDSLLDYVDDDCKALPQVKQVSQNEGCNIRKELRLKYISTLNLKRKVFWVIGQKYGEINFINDWKTYTCIYVHGQLTALI